MPFDKSKRLRVEELMDAPDVDPAKLASALTFIRWINRVLGYNKSVVNQVARVLGKNTSREMSILDVATGSGDLPADLLEFGKQHGLKLGLVGLDLHARTLQQAQEFLDKCRVQLVRADALALPFADQSFDVVTANLFLHHLSDEMAINTLREMARVSRRAVVVADLIRRRRAYAWITLLTLPCSTIVRHDARASVAHAFSVEEMKSLFERAGLDGADVQVTFGHRTISTWLRK